jgi:hypothetical protein
MARLHSCPIVLTSVVLLSLLHAAAAGDWKSVYKSECYYTNGGTGGDDMGTKEQCQESCLRYPLCMGIVMGKSGCEMCFLNLQKDFDIDPDYETFARPDTCPEDGEVGAIGDICDNCPTGRSGQPGYNMCGVCSLNEYQDEEGMEVCKICDTGLMANYKTSTSQMDFIQTFAGLLAKEECTLKCAADDPDEPVASPYACTTTTDGMPGFYLDEDKTSWLRCPDHKSTDAPYGGRSIEACSKCELGYSMVGTSCSPCPDPSPAGNAMRIGIILVMVCGGLFVIFKLSKEVSLETVDGRPGDFEENFKAALKTAEGGELGEKAGELKEKMAAAKDEKGGPGPAFGTKVTILFGGFQLNMFVWTMDMKWPPFMIKFTNWIGNIAMPDIGAVAGLECYHDQILQDSDGEVDKDERMYMSSVRCLSRVSP